MDPFSLSPLKYRISIGEAFSGRVIWQRAKDKRQWKMDGMWLPQVKRAHRLFMDERRSHSLLFLAFLAFSLELDLSYYWRIISASRCALGRWCTPLPDYSKLYYSQAYRLTGSLEYLKACSIIIIIIFIMCSITCLFVFLVQSTATYIKTQNHLYRNLLWNFVCKYTPITHLSNIYIHT